MSMEPRKTTTDTATKRARMFLLPPSVEPDPAGHMLGTPLSPGQGGKPPLWRRGAFSSGQFSTDALFVARGDGSGGSRQGGGRSGSSRPWLDDRFGRRRGTPPIRRRG